MAELINKILGEETSDKIYEIAMSPIADNSIKQEKLEALMSKKGFTEFKAGTNRITCFHPDYPGYCVKIPLDKRGIQDNLADMELYEDKDLQPYVTILYDADGVVEISENVVGIRTHLEMKQKLQDVKEILIKVAPNFLLDDVWIEQFMNWGYSNIKKHMVILDYAYLFRKDRLDLTCHRLINGEECGGILKYSNNMTEMRCPRCNRIYTFGELKDKARHTEAKKTEIKGSLETF